MLPPLELAPLDLAVSLEIWESAAADSCKKMIAVGKAPMHQLLPSGPRSGRFADGAITACTLSVPLFNPPTLASEKPTSPVMRERTVKTGTLSKSSRGKRKDGQEKDKWTNRFFVLHSGAKPRLEWFGSSAEFAAKKAPKGEVSLLGISSDFQLSRNRNSGATSFAVLGTERDLFLEAESNGDAGSWIAEICLVAGLESEMEAVAMGVDPLAVIGDLLLESRVHEAWSDPRNTLEHASRGGMGASADAADFTKSGIGGRKFAEAAVFVTLDRIPIVGTNFGSSDMTLESLQACTAVMTLAEVLQQTPDHLALHIEVSYPMSWAPVQHLEWLGRTPKFELNEYADKIFSVLFEHAGTKPLLLSSRASIRASALPCSSSRCGSRWPS